MSYLNQLVRVFTDTVQVLIEANQMHVLLRSQWYQGFILDKQIVVI